jgi:hypothetical protein
VSGRKLGLSFMASISAAAGVGIFSYYGLAKTMGRVLGALLPQIVTTLVAVLCCAFRPRVVPPSPCILRASRISCSQSVPPPPLLPHVRLHMRRRACSLGALCICPCN